MNDAASGLSMRRPAAMRAPMRWFAIEADLLDRPLHATAAGQSAVLAIAREIALREGPTGSAQLCCIDPATGAVLPIEVARPPRLLRWRTRDFAAEALPFRRTALRGSASPVALASGDVVLFLGGERHIRACWPLIRELRQSRIGCATLLHEIDGTMPSAGAPLLDMLAGLDIAFTTSAQMRRRLHAAAKQQMMGPPRLELLSPGPRVAMEKRAPSADFPKRFVLAVSSFEARGSSALAAEVWHRLVAKHGTAAMPRLVIFGERAAFDGPADAVVFMADVSQTAFDDAIDKSLFTVFYRFGEGWDMPVAESIARGKFCVASRRTPIAEKGRDLADYFDPDNIEDAVRAIERPLLDARYLRTAESRIRRQYRPATWQDCTEDLMGKLSALSVALEPGPTDRETAHAGGAVPRLRVLRSSPRATRPRKILVIKLDHLGDLLIAQPALRLLRSRFPGDKITLVCGSWNKALAESLGLFDDVLTHDYFPRNARNWDGRPQESVDHFKSITAGTYDIALDLRVDGDTRFFLGHIDSPMKFGIARSQADPFVDIPLEFREAKPDMAEDVGAGRWLFFRPDQFLTRLRCDGPFLETDFPTPNTHVWWGPYVALPAGNYAATFHLATIGLGWRRLRSGMLFDVAQHASPLATVRVKGHHGRDQLLSGKVTLRFKNTDPEGSLEFRLRIGRRPFAGRLRFLGVSVEPLDVANGRMSLDRFRRLHRGEMLTLLVQLVAERSGAATGCAAPVGPPRSGTETAALEPVLRRRGLVCVAPLSNSEIRDWPLSHYIDLVRSIRSQLRRPVALLGAAEHAASLDYIAAECGNDDGVFNLAGRTAWDELPHLFGSAALVVSNNSGIAHLAAACGVATVAIYSGSHLPEEWGPRGPGTVLTMVANVVCSPCGLEKLADCRYEHQCMRWITPQSVFGEISRILADEVGVKGTVDQPAQDA